MNNQLSSGQKFFIGLGVILLLGVVAAASFVVGAMQGARLFGPPQVIEIPVTRPVEITREVVVDNPIEVEMEVTREVTRVIEVTPEGGAVSEEAAEPEPQETIEEIVEVEVDPPARLSDGLTAEDLAVFFEVWDNVQEDFDGELPTIEELNYAMIEGALDTLDDQYTRFLDPEMAQRERESLEGAYEGIGAFVRETDEGFIEITRPIDNQPAQQAGILSGDIIIGVDGEDIIGQSIDEVINKVRGPRGTEVRLLVVREGVDEPFEVLITRARVEIPIIETAMLEGNIAYLHLTTFAAFNIDDAVEDEIGRLLAENPQALILDLRDNPGGFLDASVNIADLFLKEGVVLYERSNNGNFDRTFESFDGDIAENIPMVVLVNQGSASASELVAGSLRDNDRAILIGSQTFGKGSVQQIRSISDGSELRVTIAKWYTPDDVNINDEGLTPDIVVELNDGALLASPEDNQLQAAIDYLLEEE